VGERLSDETRTDGEAGVLSPRSPSAFRPVSRLARWESGARFLASRILRLAAGLVLLVIAMFVLIRVSPGDPASAPLGRNPDPARVAANRAELKLDDALASQLFHSVADPFRLDFGNSLVTRQPVTELFSQRLPNTMRLAIGSMIVAVVSGVVLGVAAAHASRSKRGSRADAGFIVGSGVLYAVPEFVLALVLALVFAVQLGWFPLSGVGLRSMVLPVIALSVPQSVLLSRLVRTEALRQLDAPYMRAARMKRLSTWRLYRVHLLPNVLTAAATVAGPMLAATLTGSVLVEGVFAWPGIGRPIINAVIAKDYPVVQAAVLLGGAVVLVGNAIVDVVLGVLDPRSVVRD
jgi:peptide/nickel transport system permease protein